MTLPSLTMDNVVNMFRIILVAVPDLSRVEPVRISGPTFTPMKNVGRASSFQFDMRIEGQQHRGRFALSGFSQSAVNKRGSSAGGNAHNNIGGASTAERNSPGAGLPVVLCPLHRVP